MVDNITKAALHTESTQTRKRHRHCRAFVVVLLTRELPAHSSIMQPFSERSPRPDLLPSPLPLNCRRSTGPQMAPRCISVPANNPAPGTRLPHSDLHGHDSGAPSRNECGASDGLHGAAVHHCIATIRQFDRLVANKRNGRSGQDQAGDEDVFQVAIGDEHCCLGTS